MCFSLVQHGVIEVEAASYEDAVDRVNGTTAQHLLDHAESVTACEVACEAQPDRTLHLITHEDSTCCEVCGVTRYEFLDRGECFTDDEDIFLNVRSSGFTPCESSK